jgi:hypothetical protein
LFAGATDSGGNRGCHVADGMDNDEILKAYPDLQQEDIAEALRFAAEAVRERELPLVNEA